MDEYNILRKKRNKKGGFATTAILGSLAAILLLVAIFVFLLGKVGPGNETSVVKNDDSASSEITKKNGANEENEKSDCNGKERIFRDNLREIKDAAVSYFTNERLPQVIGEKQIISLGKMQDDKMVLSIIDSNNRMCDTSKSYVEVTKEKNEYVMKINLSCSDMEDYIIIHLGCYDYCKDHVCEKQVEEGITEFEYEYKKVISCTMTDWSSWGEWSTKREKTSSTKKEDIKVITSTKSYIDTLDAIKSGTTYNCDKYGKDYKLEGTKCVKTTTVRDEIDATPSDYSYNCDKYDGYKLNGTKCEKEIITREVVEATKKETTYSCESGYKKVGTKCEREIKIVETKPALEDPIKFTCKNGYKLDGSICYRMVTKTDVKDATISCAKNYTLKDGKCIREYERREEVDATGELPTYSCPTGYKSVDVTYTVKSGDTFDSISKKYNISVEAIKKVNNITSLTVGKKISLPAKYQSVCYKNVTKTDKKDANITCPNNKYILNGTKCSLVNIDIISATPIYDMKTTYDEYSCDKQECTTKDVWVCKNGNCGFEPQTSCERVPGTCKREIVESYIKDYSCPDGYSQNGSSCSKRDTEVIDATITCDDGYKLDGVTCIKTTITKQTVKANLNTGVYSCPTGYKLDGTKCYRLVPQTDVRDIIKSCDKDYVLKDDKCVKTYDEREVISATPSPVTYSCEEGYTKTDNNMCRKESYRTETVDAKPSPDEYLCKDGYKLEGTKCVKETKTTDIKDATKVTGGYVCNEGYTLKDKKCVKVDTTVDTKIATEVIGTYTCKTGYKLEGTKCIKNVTEEVKTTYYRYATRSCTGGSIDIKWSRDENDKTLLDSGYTKTGNKRKIDNVILEK